MKLILSSLRILRAVIIVLLLAITLLLYIILETPVGLQLACKLAPAFVPFTLQIDNPQGALLDNISVDKFIYRDKYVDVEVTHARIHLEPWLLFSKEVRLDYAHAADVSVIVFNNDTPSTMTREKLLNDLTLPIGIHLMNASTQHLLVGEQDRTPWVDAYGVNGSNILMNGVPRIAVDAQWQRGTLGFIPNVNLHTAQGALWIDSHLPDYNFKFAAHLKYNDDATDRLVHLVGQGDFSSVTLSKMSLHEENNHFSAPMKITWLPYFILEIPSIQGQWHHYPIQGHISLRNEDQHWVIDNSELTVHDASVTVNGQYQQQGQFNFKIAIPHIETLIEHSHGHLFSTGTWQGDTTAPHLEASVDAGDIKVGDDLLLQKLQGKVTANSTYPIQNQSYWTQFSINANATADKIQLADNHLEHADLQLNGAIDGQHAGSLLAQLTHLQINGELIKSVKLSAQNKNFSQQISIASSIGDKTISSTLSGHYQNNIWQGFLETLQTNFNVHLQKRTPLTLSKNTVQINSLCFALKTSSLCGNLNWQKDQPSTASVTGKNIPLDIISKFFLPESNTTGTLSIDAQMTLLNQKLQTGKMNLALSNGKFTDHAGDTPIHLAFRASQFNINLSSQGLTSQGELNILEQPPIRWQLSANKLDLNNPNWRNTPIQGSLQFNTTQLAPLGKLYPQLKNIKGTIAANAKIAGSFANPDISGDINFKQGQLDIPALGLHLAPIQFNAHGEKNRITYMGDINTNPGRLTIQGYTDLSANNRKTVLLINGQAITVIHTSEYQVSASPQLQLNWSDSLLAVEGAIIIPKAKINPIDLGDTITVSNDVVFVTGKEKQNKAKLPIQTNVKIILGDAVYLNVKGLTARLAGAVTVKEAANSDQTTGIGQINIINGQYKAHGQNLTIRTGRAIFTGSSVTNPGLYVEAVRKVTAYATPSSTTATGGTKNSSQPLGALQQDMIVGARITGTVDTPQITFFSEPSGLTQSQILSYLVLGKGQSSGSDLDTALLLKAVSFLDIGGEETAATKSGLEKDLGLDEVGIQSQQEYDTQSQSLVNNTSLVLGKALSPKLFVDYSIGLIEPINILRIQYQLSQHFSVRSESNSNAQGIDLFYSIER